MEKAFIGVLCGLHDDAPELLVAARAILDFIYLAHYPSHTTSTLEQMQQALDDFHKYKQVFIDVGARTESRAHFNIPKIHSMIHYIPSIMDIGTCDGTNTEISERLHIDYAKLGYRASNRKAYLRQMVTWLTRREKMARLDRYVRWVDTRPSSHPSSHSDQLPGHAYSTSLDVYPITYEDELPFAHGPSTITESEDTEEEAAAAAVVMPLQPGRITVRTTPAEGDASKQAEAEGGEESEIHGDMDAGDTDDPSVCGLFSFRFLMLTQSCSSPTVVHIRLDSPSADRPFKISVQIPIAPT